MLAALPGVAADSQRKSLGQSLAPDQRIVRLSVFDWRVIHCEGLILPDCVAVASDPHGQFYPLMLAELDEVASIFLPLSSERLLVGSHDGAVPDVTALDAAFAGCSWDFFVARDRTPELEALRETLRSRIASHLDTLVDGAIADAVKDRPAP